MNNTSELQRTRYTESLGSAPASDGVGTSGTHQRTDAHAASSGAVSLLVTASSSTQSLACPSFMRLAVVERQLVMQGLEIKSLSRLACTCTKLRAESMRPASGRFLPALHSVSTLLPLSDRSEGHDCPLVRAHIPVTARLDRLDTAPSDQRAAALDKLIQTIQSFRCVTSLSLWDSPEDISEADALRLIAAVPLVETLFGVRTGSVFVQSRRVQEAISLLPHLTKCSFDFAKPGGEFQPTLLALTPKLQNVIISAPASDLSPLLLLPFVPHLRRVWLVLLPTLSSSREVLSVSLPFVEEFGFEAEDDESEPTIAQIEALTRGMPALKRITLSTSEIISAVLRSIMSAGPRAFPSLEWIKLESDRYDAVLIADFLAIFPAVDFCLPIDSEADGDSALLDVKRITSNANGHTAEYISVHRLPVQPAPQ